MEIVRFAFAALFIICGLFILGVATLGVYRLGYVLNRIHAAAKCDTLGTMLVLIGIAIITGASFTTLKMMFLMVFMWLAGPSAVFMLGRAEVLSNPYIEEELEVVE